MNAKTGAVPSGGAATMRVASEWVRDLDEADQYHIRSAAEKDCAMVQAKTKATLTVVERPVKKGK